MVWTCTSMYILKRAGNSSVRNVSPSKLWISKKLRINLLRILGFICCAPIPNERKKNYNKAIRAYLTGYYPANKYYVWIVDPNFVTCWGDERFNGKLLNCRKLIQLPIIEEDKNDS